MHLSFITGLVGKRFPADYPFYPGHRLSYPFLADSLSSTFCLMGCSLQAAVIFPGTFMMMLCYMGVMILGREMTTGRKTVVLAALLFFLNGGLGFLYDFDQAAGYNGNGGLTVLDRLRNILEGYYKTPTNQPEPNNLRWSNVICGSDDPPEDHTRRMGHGHSLLLSAGDPVPPGPAGSGMKPDGGPGNSCWASGQAHCP